MTAESDGMRRVLVGGTLDADVGLATERRGLQCSKAADSISIRKASATADGIILRVSSIREL